MSTSSTVAMALELVIICTAASLCTWLCSLMGRGAEATLVATMENLCGQRRC